MSRFRQDPGDCPICGAAHCACGGGGPIAIVQLPMRDAAAATAPGEGQPPSLVSPAAADPAPVLVAETVQATLPPGHVTTGTYRGTKKRRT